MPNYFFFLILQFMCLVAWNADAADSIDPVSLSQAFLEVRLDNVEISQHFDAAHESLQVAKVVPSNYDQQEHAKFDILCSQLEERQDLLSLIKNNRDEFNKFSNANELLDAINKNSTYELIFVAKGNEIFHGKEIPGLMEIIDDSERSIVVVARVWRSMTDVNDYIYTYSFSKGFKYFETNGTDFYNERSGYNSNKTVHSLLLDGFEKIPRSAFVPEKPRRIPRMSVRLFLGMALIFTAYQHYSDPHSDSFDDVLMCAVLSALWECVCYNA